MPGRATALARDTGLLIVAVTSHIALCDGHPPAAYEPACVPRVVQVVEEAADLKLVPWAMAPEFD